LLGHIEGVQIQDLKQFIDDRGRVMHMLRSDNLLFSGFGEVYFSEILPGVIKAWKRHKRMTQHFAVPVGMVRLVVYDDRAESSTRHQVEVFEIGAGNYQLIKIPPKLWYGFKCTSQVPALIANVTDIPHFGEESEAISPEALSIKYRW
jgi:dTDP-4-dehydrorhamnose 3,5-epimerase